MRYRITFYCANEIVKVVSIIAETRDLPFSLVSTSTILYSRDFINHWRSLARIFIERNNRTRIYLEIKHLYSRYLLHIHTFASSVRIEATALNDRTWWVFINRDPPNSTTRLDYAPSYYFSWLRISRMWNVIYDSTTVINWFDPLFNLFDPTK